jgi:hypothetical protein
MFVGLMMRPRQILTVIGILSYLSIFCKQFRFFLRLLKHIFDITQLNIFKVVKILHMEIVQFLLLRTHLHH